MCIVLHQVWASIIFIHTLYVNCYLYANIICKLHVYIKNNVRAHRYKRI